MLSAAARRPPGGGNTKRGSVSKAFLRNNCVQNEASRRQSDLLQAVQRERKRRERARVQSESGLYNRVATILICPAILLLSSGGVFTLASWWPAFGDGTIFHKMPFRKVFNVVGPILLCIGLVSGTIVYVFYHKMTRAAEAKKANLEKNNRANEGKATSKKDRRKRGKDRKLSDLGVPRDSDTTWLLSSSWQQQSDQDRKYNPGSHSIFHCSPCRVVKSRHQSSQTTFSCFDSEFDSGGSLNLLSLQKGNEFTRNSVQQSREGDGGDRGTGRAGIQYQRQEVSVGGTKDGKTFTTPRRPSSYQLSLIEHPFDDNEARNLPVTIKSRLQRERSDGVVSDQPSIMQDNTYQSRLYKEPPSLEDSNKEYKYKSRYDPLDDISISHSPLFPRQQNVHLGKDFSHRSSRPQSISGIPTAISQPLSQNYLDTLQSLGKRTSGIGIAENRTLYDRSTGPSDRAERKGKMVTENDDKFIYPLPDTLNTSTGDCLNQLHQLVDEAILGAFNLQSRSSQSALVHGSSHNVGDPSHVRGPGKQLSQDNEGRVRSSFSCPSVSQLLSDTNDEPDVNYEARGNAGYSYQKVDTPRVNQCSGGTSLLDETVIDFNDTLPKPVWQSVWKKVNPSREQGESDHSLITLSRQGSNRTSSERNSKILSINSQQPAQNPRENAQVDHTSEGTLNVACKDQIMGSEERKFVNEPEYNVKVSAATSQDHEETMSGSNSHQPITSKAGTVAPSVVTSGLYSNTSTANTPTTRTHGQSGRVATRITVPVKQSRLYPAKITSV